MGWWGNLFAKRVDTEFPALVEVDKLTPHLPPGALYVTRGEVMVLSDAVAFNGGPAGNGWGHGRDPSWRPGPGDGPRIVGLLALTPDALSVVSVTGVVHSIPVHELSALDSDRRIGFVLFCRDGSGLEIGQHVPVRSPHFDTAGRVTNQFAGWNEALTPLGVETHW